MTAKNKPLPFRTAYGPKRRSRLGPFEPTKTKQSFKNECDINNIMAKFQKTGVITHLNQNSAQYGFAPAVDFSTALQLVAAAREQFAGLPSKVRARFNNDPGEFLAFCEDPDNRTEAAVLGLLDKPDPEPESPSPQPSDSQSAPQAPNPADVEPTHESA